MSFGIAGTTEGNRVFQECIANGYALLGWGDDVDFSECATVAEIRKKLEDEHNDVEKLDSQVRFVSTFKNEVKNGDLIVASQGNKAFRAIGEVIGDYEYLEAGAAGTYHQMRPVRWLAVFEGNRPVDDIYEKNFQQSTLYRLDNDAIKFDTLEDLISDRQENGDQAFVLIIDEINRANISKVFGELITLLEPDKREGEENALTVKLPYSGDEFSVPSNLYVVGTMNTADRSIALLDTALRRRFEFEELQPSPETLQGVSIDGVGLTAMLQALNERVEYLYDRDHTIGHAYFINVRTLEDLEATFRRKVIPLLQEYFYEDWSKVRLALNDQSGQFIETIEGIPKGLENTADGYEARPRYRVRKGPFSLDAYLNIYR
ncbi:MAG: AAA family ATPase [Rhizobium sp.]|nr:AAA family ATPase [Rhizobium sp.]